MYFLPVNLGLGMIYNNLFLQNIHQCFLLGLMEITAILFTYKFPENYLITRFFYNLVSQDGIKIILAFLTNLFVQYYITKGARELWALFDSFKKSYYNLKTVYDEFPYPVFVVSRKQYSILYKNLEADKLYENSKKQNQQADSKQNLTFQSKSFGRKMQ